MTNALDARCGELGLKSREAADLAGVSHVTISEARRGKRKLSLSTAPQIARALGMKLEELPLSKAARRTLLRLANGAAASESIA